MKRYLLIFALLPLMGLQAADFQLISNDKAADIYYGGNNQVVNTAIEMLEADFKQVCKQPMKRLSEMQANAIVVGVLNENTDFNKLLLDRKIDISKVKNKWEAYKIVTAQLPQKGNCLVVIGSDPRGAAYGLLELSRSIGVDPWEWWADVKPQTKADVTYQTDDKVHAPSVQYRGIFLNDEDWGLLPWSTKTFEPTGKKGAMGPKTYSKIFELLLRLRANCIWPAMHKCTRPFYCVDGNREAADKYGIVIGNSHCEPMARTNTGEWNNSRYGAYNFLTNHKRVLDYWEERIKELTHSENLFTIGMRGIHDGRMQGVKSVDDETKALEQVFEAQRDILKCNFPNKKIEDIPQVFVPYKEVLRPYDNGLKVPEDVTLVWCNDSHGYIMRLSNPEEQKRKGGAGVYYHISYWGNPHDYLWLGSTQPGLIYSEMRRAWDENARRFWIVNVGDIKPGEYLTEFFLDMAWDINAFSGNQIYSHLENWIHRVFGDELADDIFRIQKEYYLLAAQRKPEHMGWNSIAKSGQAPVEDTEFSATEFGDEMERRIAAYDSIAALSQKLYKTKVPKRLKDAYFQLVHYPVMGASALNRKILYAQKSRMYAESNPKVAQYYAQLATDAYNEVAALDYTYNKDIAKGKWNLMMDMKPRDLRVFQEPRLTVEPSRAALSGNVSVPVSAPLVNTAGTPVEGDQMIALKACDYVNKLSAEKIEALGHSGLTVRLPVAKKISKKQPHLEYKVKTTSTGEVDVKIGLIPKHSVYGKTKLRYALVIDDQKPIIVASAAPYNTSKWKVNVLRNQSLTTSRTTLAKLGEHTICIYALDEELLVDQLMLDFKLDRKFYLIPTK